MACELRLSIRGFGASRGAGGGGRRVNLFLVEKSRHGSDVDEMDDGVSLILKANGFENVRLMRENEHATSSI